MNMEILQQEIHSYFANLNPLAERISRDMAKAKLDWKDCQTFSTTEQDKMLNNFFMKPEITLKYEKYNHVGNTSTTYNFNGRNLCTFMYQNVASKTLHDENSKYRDEHSSPFCYRTKSQMNLSVIATQKSESSNPTESCEPYDVNHLPNSQFFEIPAPQDAHKTGLAELENLKAVTNISNEKKVLSKRNSHTEQITYDDGDAGCYFIPDEKTNLLDNFGSNGISNSSSTDLYEDENDAKDLSQEEKTKLLSAEVEIPKGFDFLSNW